MVIPYREAFAYLKKKLKGVSDEIDSEAKIILSYLTETEPNRLLITLPSVETEAIDTVIEKRRTGTPLQYIIGRWWFFGLEFLVGEGVLIPRQDTEILVETAISLAKGITEPKIADLCSGSGAIAIALEKFSGAEVTAVELSEKAFKFLEKNIKLNDSKVSPVLGDVFKCYSDFPDNSFDLIVSNPPYIATDELKGLQAEVQFEPMSALDGGADGLIFYREIVKNWSGKLKSGGALVFELGENQAKAVAEMMKAQGFGNIRTELDFGGTQRAIIGTMLDK